MISPAQFCDLLLRHNMAFYCGVPDSLLKNLCDYVDTEFTSKQHIITANEGNAVGLASGHFMGSGKPGVVYMQNSGLGNAINPLTSLADPAVYSIPMLLVIGWRGEPGVADEPQHIKQGQMSVAQLSVLDIPYVILDADADLKVLLEPLLNIMFKQNRPVAVLVRKGTFSGHQYDSSPAQSTEHNMLREEALSVLMDMFETDDIVLSTTGKTSREVFEIRQSRNQIANDFLTVGGMGHASSIAMGVALAKPSRRVIVIDGDGSMLMHLGALPIIGAHKINNLVHIVLNNECHESVGGQATVAGLIDISSIAIGSGYVEYLCAESPEQLLNVWKKLCKCTGPVLLEIKIKPGSRSDLARPNRTPIQNKQQFMLHTGGLSDV